MPAPDMLFPGLPVEATADFDPRYNRVTSVLMHANARGDGIRAALTEHYGRPKITGSLARYLSNPIAVTGGTRLIEMYAYKWCDGARQFALNGGPEDFWLSVSPIER